MQFMVLASVAALISLLLIAYNITIFEIMYHSIGRKGIGLDYIGHIVVCVIVYIFLVSLLSINLGAVIHKVGNRIAGYGLIVLLVFISSPYMERITNTLMDTMNLNAFALKNIFDVFPINLSFIPNTSFGFSVLPYKIALILFWIGISGAIIALMLSKKKLPMILMVVVSICSLAAYALPSSKVIMDNSPEGSAMHDMFYYENDKSLREEKAAFDVSKYQLELDIGRQLDAEAKLTVSKGKLDQYGFTLYHGYRVNTVKNQTGEILEFSQARDYLTIKRGTATTEKIIIQYSGAAKAYYSNYQGIYLTGDFQYYPIAGYKKLADTESGMLVRQFLNQKVDFDVKVQAYKKVYSNLPQKEKNHFVGSANGLTLMAGMLTETRSGSNKVIWPTYEDYGEQGLELYTLQLLAESGYENCTFVIIPNMNQGGSFCHISEEQIVSTTPFFKGDGFKKEWINLLTKGKDGDS